MSLLALTAQQAAMSFPEMSPAIFQIDLGFLGLGKFPIRWYALSYIYALLMGWRLALALVQRPALWGGSSPATRDDIDDLLFYVTLGVILGGRFGYILFYQLPYQWDQTMSDPMSLLRIWEGGMSFHGGLLGVVVAIFWVTRQRSIPLLSIGDIAGVVAPLGPLFGRIANFINAELYGRPTPEGSSWGMIFPEGYVAGSTPSAFNWGTGEWVYRGDEVARYPSQLYEAVLEGLIPAIVLPILVWRFKALQRPGLIAGLFLLFYAFGRTVSEQFREPDAFVQGLPEWITMGQILSLPMWVGGAWLVWNALKKPGVSTTA
ncbi:MAG: prolipoprotein diacylglyceryl transferase [Henriciella sp.]|nr:prolipoprotein diacylglyceryl transferase [Henriciella sp.]MBO6694147.1 prolipoprotein diacylglyceryl transferase [Henriciella sp.]